jgi:cell division protein ZapA (FtsZ GTPase activity inhibitor)
LDLFIKWVAELKSFFHFLKQSDLAILFSINIIIPWLL